jgi:diguanylate cyclase (GGDEF)-like protein
MLDPGHPKASPQADVVIVRKALNEGFGRPDDADGYATTGRLGSGPAAEMGGAKPPASIRSTFPSSFRNRCKRAIDCASVKAAMHRPEGMSPARAVWKHRSDPRIRPRRPTEGAQSTRSSGIGVTFRLIALVMLPVTAMCVLAGSVVLSRRISSSQAGAVDRGVVWMSQLVELRDALHAQQSVEAFDARFLEEGVTRAAATGFIGVDWAVQVAPARATASQALKDLGPRIPFAISALDSLYAEIDSGVIAPAAAVQRFSGLIDSSAAAFSKGLDQLEVNAHQVPLVAALESLRTVSTLVDAATPQGIDLSAIWVPSPRDTPQSTQARLTRFGAETADYAAGVARLRELGVATVVAAVGRVESDLQVQPFDEAVATSLRGQPLPAVGPSPDIVKLAAALRGYLTRDTLLDDLVKTVVATARDQAVQLATSERASFLTWALVGAALALVSIGVALALARSISKPLKSLAGYAHAVNEGQLDVDPPSRHHRGPRETRLAFGVFTDLVGNLQLLDAKTNALAHCDFDNPALNKPLPGRLGRSLESSVALLSGSIVERDQLQTHLAHEATHDSLTGIGNRPAAIAAIQAAMHRAARTGTATAVLFVDLNEFKAVNDSHGHEVGDAVLRTVADRIVLGLRIGDFVARLGGDEFVVVAEAVADVADATDMARRIIDAVSQVIEVGPLRITIGAAVGIALTLDGPEEPLRLLARADSAMYRAKRHDGSAVEIFDTDLQRQMIEREGVETDLTVALAEPAGGGLRLVYQPVLEVGSGALVGVEALIRWDRPGHGLLTPDSFIPIAEATTLIIELDCWVLDEATRQLLAWSSVTELAEISVAVNISGRHLLSRLLPGHISGVLDRTGIDPRRLSIEITETVLLTDLVAAAGELDAVRALGVRVALDDFGTGYTSLAHLQQLPIDTIKIDRSFTNQLNERRGTSLVRMVADLGHAIDITVLAEGVETGEQLQALQAVGADQLQGYLLSRPLESAALATWARKRAAQRHALGRPRSGGHTRSGE